MAAYCFWNVREVKDPLKMERYRDEVFDVVAKFGGKYLAIGGPFERVEGDWEPVFPVLIEFPSMEAARSWYRSDEYRELRDLRLEATVGDAVFIESVNQPAGGVR